MNILDREIAPGHKVACHYAEEIKADSKAYVAEMDRFTEALDWLRARTDSQPKV